MSSNPYEPTCDASPASAGKFSIGIAWLLILLGAMAVILGIFMIASNVYVALQERGPFRIKLLKLFIFTSLGALPVFFGLALQYYGRRFLRWRTRLPERP